MEDMRSKSFGDSRMQIQPYGMREFPHPPPNGLHDLRSYSTSYANPASSSREIKLKKEKGASSSSSGRGLSDPEFQRKMRVASYKVYSVEGKVKGSLRKSFRWFKDRYTQVVYGWW